MKTNTRQDFNTITFFQRVYLAVNQTSSSYMRKLPNTIAEELNQDLENVSIWLSANKLTLNKTKTEYMIIGSNRRRLF